MNPPAHPQQGENPPSPGPEGDRTLCAKGQPEQHPGVLQPVAQDLANVHHDLSRYVALQRDHLKSQVRRGVLIGVAGCVGLVVLLAAMFDAVLLTLQGIAGGLADLFGGRVWVGNLTTGLLLLGGFAAILIAAAHYSTRRSLRRMEVEYGRDGEMRIRDGVTGAPALDREASATEAEFLERELAQTQRDLREDCEKTGKSLRHAVDVRAWSKRHPWLGIALATFCGYTVASKGIKRFLHRTSSQPLDKAAAEPAAKDAAGLGERADRTIHESTAAAVLGAISGPLFKMLEGVLLSLIATFLGRRASASRPPSAPADDSRHPTGDKTA